jgi:hypothetical protein
MPKTLLLLFLLLPFAAISQVSITGRVINQADTKPVADASVFISNATIGDRTAVDGKFTLKNLRPGKYELVVSLVGFDAYKQNITVEDKDINLPDITIYPKTIALGEVKVKANRDPDRQRNYDWFKDEFLGKSELAKETKIINPELLDLQYDERNGILKGSSVDFLIIENRALGYRMKYLLSDFMLNNYDEKDKSFSYAGSVLFEKMKGTVDEEQQWKAKRQEVYEGSQLHFLRSAYSNKINEEGFRILKVAVTRNPQRPADSIINENIKKFTALKNEKRKNSYKDSLAYWIKQSKLPSILHTKLLSVPLTRPEFIRRTNQPGLYALMTEGNDPIFITYDKYHHFNTGAYSHLSDPDNHSSTLLSFNEPAAFFDGNGAVINPRSLSYEGVWSRNRVASLLPVDYEPDGDNSIEVDTALVNSIGNKYSGYMASHITEKAYLHFDKPYYSAGDTIYFKAYVTAGERNELSYQSGVLYAQLINEENKVCKSIRMYIKDGVTWGDFALPQSFSSGNYRVRAYTQWMRNDGEEAFFEKIIPIGSAIKPQIPESGNSQPKIKKPDLEFFPEGGSLIADIPSKIAFKAVGPNGLGVEVKGVVIDQDKREVATFSSAHLGMGYFYLTPSENKVYTAKVIYADGKQDNIELPKANDNNIGLAVTSRNSSYDIKISSSKQWFRENKNKSYTLIIYSGGNPQSYTINLDNAEKNLVITKAGLKTGIATATLFSVTGEPLCERLLFVQNNDGLKINIETDNGNYSTRAKIGIKLNVTKDGSAPVQGNFSVSVVDEGIAPVDENAESTIVNNLLLTSDLKGYVEQPNYYFTNITEKTNADLDLVMLTHGYRRFEWQKILNTESAIAYQPEKGLSISGQVKFNSKALENGKVKLFSNGAGRIMLDTITNANGRFVFDNLSFNDTTKFVLQARTAKGQREVDIKPDTIISEPEITAGAIPTVELGNVLMVYEQNSKRYLDELEKYGINKHRVMLKEVVIEDKKVIPFEHSDNLNGRGNADQVLDAAYFENTPYNSLFDAVRVKVPSVIYTQDHKLISNRSVNANGKPDYMIIIVDGTPQFNMDQTTLISHGILDNYSSSDIESVEILLGAHYGAIYGSIASGGAVIVTTKRARKINNYYKEAPGVITFRANGFYKAREFYSPQYDNPKTNIKMADLRSTIYWQPNIITDKDGKASFSYFNADGKGTYRVVVEGIDADGNLGRQVYRYKVE